MRSNHRSGITGGEAVALILVASALVEVSAIGYFVGVGYSSVTTYVGAVQYTSTFDGKTTLVLNNQTVVCSLTTDSLTAPLWGFKTAPASPPLEVINLKVGQFVAVQQNYLGQCLVTTK